MIIGLYVCGAFAACSVWLSAFLRDESTPKSDVFSWMVIAIATITWPLSIPLSIRERSVKQEQLLLAETTLDMIAES